MAREEVRHISSAAFRLANPAVLPTLCGQPCDDLTVPLNLCSHCEEAEGLGSPQARMFPSPPGMDWHLRDIWGRLYCGAISEAFGMDVRSLTATIPLCTDCRKVYRDMKAGVSVE